MAHQPKPIRKAVFPVAGLGTRFLPATKAMPKEMLPIGDRPLIQRVVEEAADAGIEEFIFVTGRHKELLEEHFDCQPELVRRLEERGKVEMVAAISACDMPAGRLVLTRQPQPLGLGHAVWCARKLVGDDPFAVILPDDIIYAPQGCLSQMIEIYGEKGGNIVATRDVPRDETGSYGILDIAADDGRVVDIKGLVEKPAPAAAPSTLSIVGRYILQPDIFALLERQETGAGNEIQLTDAMVRLLADGQPFRALRFDGQHFDCGSRLGFIEANIVYGLADPRIGARVADLLKTYSAGPPAV